MNTLFPHLPFDAEETPASFAVRLAAFHLGTPVTDSLRDIGVMATDLLDGEVHAIKRLALLADVDPDALHRNVAQRTGMRSFVLRGNAVSREFFDSPTSGFCPACLLEDDREIGGTAVAVHRKTRMAWSIRAYRTCSRHHLPLVHRERAAQEGRVPEMALRVPERGDDLKQLVDLSVARALSGLQSYVSARLEGVSGPEWLDGQSLEQAVRATEMLGVLIAFGPKRKPRDLGIEDWEMAAREGFEATSHGEDGIKAALADAQASFRATGDKSSSKKIFGAFYEWLQSRRLAKDPGDIKRIVREHICETMAVATGEKVLGEPLSQRRLHTVESLALQAGLDHRAMRNVLIASGLIPGGAASRGHHVFDAKAGEELAASVSRRVNVSSLPKALNCTRPQADQLLDERLLTALVDDPQCSVSKVQKGVDQREIDAFLAALHRRAREVDEVPANLVTVFKAAQKTRAQSSEIAHLILAGFLTDLAKLKGTDGYAAILVNPDEVREQLQRRMPGMAASVALRMLKMPIGTAWDLVHRRFDVSLDPIVIEGIDGAHRIYRFEEKGIEAFISKFTTDARLATEHGMRRAEMGALLRKAGIRPALCRKQAGLQIYRTAEVRLPEMA
jgi:hypothetical protein